MLFSCPLFTQKLRFIFLSALVHLFFKKKKKNEREKLKKGSSLALAQNSLGLAAVKGVPTNTQRVRPNNVLTYPVYLLCFASKFLRALRWSGQGGETEGKEKNH